MLLFKSEFTNSIYGFIPILISTIMFIVYTIIAISKHGTYEKLESCLVVSIIIIFALIIIYLKRENIINNLKIKQLTPIFLAILFPFWMYYIGTISALYIITSLDYKQVNPHFNKKLYNNLSLDQTEKIKYLGGNTKFIFLILKDNSVAIIKRDSIDHLVFNPHDKQSSFFNYIFRSLTLLTK